MNGVTNWNDNLIENAPSDFAPNAELARVFNSALVASVERGSPQYSKELASVMQSKEFGAILSVIQKLSQATGEDFNQSAIKVIHTFRKLDRLWESCLINEGFQAIVKK